MESLSLLIIFWYGILHAFGPDHLTAIADFSIGKAQKRALLITFAFAIGHGVSLFIFAKLLESFEISETLLGYGDMISSAVIIGIGIFLLFMAGTDRIQMGTHLHDGKEHVHIWFGKEHSHRDEDRARVASAFTIGTLMGIGGVRGMLITLSAISHQAVNLWMVLSFTLGVMVIFIGFGFIIAKINENMLKNKRNIRTIFSAAGFISVVVGLNMLAG